MPSDAQRPLRFVAVGLFATAVHDLAGQLARRATWHSEQFHRQLPRGFLCNDRRGGHGVAAISLRLRPAVARTRCSDATVGRLGGVVVSSRLRADHLHHGRAELLL